MSFFKDEYLIEYLLQNGYSEEELMSDSFSWLDLQREFDMPIDLDRVTNLEELRKFVFSNVEFEVSRDAIESGKLEKATQFMVETKLVAKEPNLKLNKIYVNCAGAIFNKDGTMSNVGGLVCKLEGFDLAGLEIAYDTSLGLDKPIDNPEKPYCFPIFKKDGIDNSIFLAEFTSDYLKYMPKVTLENCRNLDISELDASWLTLNNCIDVIDSGKTSIFDLTLNNHKGNLDFVSSLDLTFLRINGMDELDLSSIDVSDEVSVTISNIDNCFLSQDKHFSGKVKFNDVSFQNPYGKKVSFDKDLLISNSDMISQVKMIEAKQELELKSCDIGMVDAVTVGEKLRLSDMSVGFEMEEFKKQYGYALNYKEGIKAKDGFDLRRLDRVLDFNLEENRELLENPDLLKIILENNRFLETIMVSPNLSLECKAVLEKYAPDKYYAFEFENGIEMMSKKIWTYGDGQAMSQDEVVDFNAYSEADEIYTRLMDGLNPEWSDLEKFKYLYNQLGMITSYDVNVLSGNDDLDSHDSANIVARNPFSSILTSRGVCAGISESYKYLCKKAGLECTMEGSGNHRYNIIEYENEKGEKVRSYCDLTWDYDYIKRGQRCLYFAKSSEDFKKDHPGIQEDNLVGIDIDEQEKIDKKIGHIDKEYPTKKYAQMLEPYVEITNNEDKVNVVLQKMMELGELRHMADREIISFARDVLKNANIDKCGRVDSFIRRKDAVEKETRGILWVEDEARSTDDKKEYLYYVFNSEQQAFKSADYELIEELLANGMLEFYADTKLPGFEDWGSEKQIQEKLNDRAKAAAQDR